MTYRVAIGMDVLGQFLDTIRKSQQAILEALTTWSETVKAITPSLPSFTPPGADKLPKPAELVSNAYDFAEQLLASQRRFAEDVLQATASVMTRKDDTSDK